MYFVFRVALFSFQRRVKSMKYTVNLEIRFWFCFILIGLFADPAGQKFVWFFFFPTDPRLSYFFEDL